MGIPALGLGWRNFPDMAQWLVGESWFILVGCYWFIMGNDRLIEERSLLYLVFLHLQICVDMDLPSIELEPTGAPFGHGHSTEGRPEPGEVAAQKWKRHGPMLKQLTNAYSFSMGQEPTQRDWKDSLK